MRGQSSVTVGTWEREGKEIEAERDMGKRGKGD